MTTALPNPTSGRRRGIREHIYSTGSGLARTADAHPWDTPGGRFGRSVALRGRELAIGAYWTINPSAPSGAIYVQ